MKEIIQAPFLTKNECQLVHGKVLELLPYWRKLNWPKSRGNAPFYILGYAIFSCREAKAEHRRGYSKLNPILWRELRWLYRRVQSFLEEQLGAKVEFRKDASLPGFHILLNHPAFTRLSGHWHIDQDAMLLKWKQPLDLEQIRAFTLPVALPSSGASIDYLNVHYRDLQAIPFSLRKRTIESGKILRSLPHKIGHIVLQDGMRFHRIGMLPKVSDTDDKRITLQGFVVRQGKRWQAYW